MPKGYPVDPNASTKWCPSCKQHLPWGNFHMSSSTVTGYQNRCKECGYKSHNKWRLKNLTKVAEDQKKHRDANVERHKDYGRKAHYGLEPGEYAYLLEKQNGKCAICLSSDPKGKGAFHVDHCHDTHRIRGLLCHHCNLGIGQFKHREDFLLRAIDYLKR
mgnify:CR=1 FL=1